jgi:RNA polymerase sigma-70 factor, ECF subfamily
VKEDIVQATAMQIKALSEPPGELESLFREYYSQIFRAAYRITGSVVDAEDVLQTVFLRLARRKEGFDLSPSPESYLLRAAVNASLDLVRSKTRTTSVSFDQLEPDHFQSSQPGPEAVHTDRELQKRLRLAVAGLGAKAAEIFALRYFEGHDNREIAKMLGTSQLVVAVVLHRARGRVRKEIGQFLEESHETN